ncbi:MAG: NUDIX hydrolase [Clostridia bacterium]|nr:NUDIX hydrolase [Clostridia bacterium]
MDLTEKQLSTKRVFDGYVVKLSVDDVLLPDGSASKREVIRHSGAVCVAPITKDGNIIMVRQFRYAVNKELLELPAGRIDPSEPPETTGIRELREETGYSVSKLHYIGRLYPTPGYSDEVIWLYSCVVSPEDMVSTDMDEGEFVETEILPLQKAIDMVMEDGIFDSKTQILLLRINEEIRRGKIQL